MKNIILDENAERLIGLNHDKPKYRVIQAIKFIHILNKLKKTFQLRPETALTLLWMIEYYVNKSKLSTATSICEAIELSKSGSIIFQVRRRVTLLIDKGLVMKMPISRGIVRYAPTEKAINGLRQIITEVGE